MPVEGRSPVMLGALIESARPVIVAGCITDFAEQEMVLDAFVTERESHPDALLVLAPRHPEVTERMRTLREYLKHSGLPAVFRPTISDVITCAQIACLVLDSMGELRDFYAAATVTHVGVDHNVLEPLGFGKPVTVKPGWDTTYPSYPVYRTLINANTLFQADKPGPLSAHWLYLLDHPEQYRKHIVDTGNTLNALHGAVARHMQQVGPFLPIMQSARRL